MTIVMACRDPKRAQGARTQLLAILDQHIDGLPVGSNEREYAVTFRKNVRIEMEVLDLASVRSVLEFGKTVSQKCVLFRWYERHMLQPVNPFKVRIRFASNLQCRDRDI